MLICIAFHFKLDNFAFMIAFILINSSLKFEIMAKQLYVASQRVL